MKKFLSMSLLAAATFTASQGSAQTTQTWAIAGGAQDAEQVVSTGAVSLTGVQLGLGTGYVGLRFAVGSVIPIGANIQSATIKFTAKGDSAGVGGWKLIGGQKAVSTAAFAAVTNDLSSRADTDTTAKAAWKPPAWLNNESGANQTTPNLAGVVQEIVD